MPGLRKRFGAMFALSLRIVFAFFVQGACVLGDREDAAVISIDDEHRENNNEIVVCHCTPGNELAWGWAKRGTRDAGAG